MYSKNEHKIFVLLFLVIGLNFGHCCINLTRESGGLQQCLREFNRTVTQFSLDYYEALAKKNPGTSVIASPLAVMISLAQLSIFAIGKTQAEITNVMKLYDLTEAVLNNVIETLNDKSVSSGVLELAAAMFIDENAQLNDEFIETNKYVFYSEPQKVDFRNREEAANTINNWIAAKTHNKIQQIVSQDMFHRSTPMALVNTMYFLGTWHQKFEKETKMDKFYSSKGVKQIEFMNHEKRHFMGKSNELDASVLKLQYLQSDYQCIILLPNSQTGLKDLISKIQSDTSVLTRIIEDPRFGRYMKVKVTLPVIKIQLTTDMKPILKQLGIKTIFTDRAQFNNITNNKIPLKVSAAMQGSYISMNQNGTEAAAGNLHAATFLSAMTGHVPTFNANHPYLFAIVRNNLVLFIGSFDG